MTAAEFDTQAAAAIDALTSMGARLPVSQLLLTLDSIAPGETRFQLATELFTVDEASDSNITRHLADALVTVHHRLSAAESVYRTGVMLDHQTALLRPSFWSALAAVFRVTEGPELEDSVDREGFVISYSMKVRCALNP